MYISLKDCRVIAWSLSHPWSCDLSVDPELMVQEYRVMLRAKLSSEDMLNTCNWCVDVSYRIVPREKDNDIIPVYETCLILVFGSQRVGTIARLKSDGSVVTFLFTDDDEAGVQGLEGVSFKASDSLRDVVFDSRDVV